MGLIKGLKRISKLRAFWLKESSNKLLIIENKGKMLWAFVSANKLHHISSIFSQLPGIHAKCLVYPLQESRFAFRLVSYGFLKI